MTTVLKKARDFLSDEAHWARDSGDNKTTACIITARWVASPETVFDEKNNDLDCLRTAIAEWYEAHPDVGPGPSYRTIYNAAIVDFNDRYCPSHADLMWVLDRAVELQGAAE